MEKIYIILISLVLLSCGSVKKNMIEKRSKTDSTSVKDRDLTQVRLKDSTGTATIQQYQSNAIDSTYEKTTVIKAYYSDGVGHDKKEEVPAIIPNENKGKLLYVETTITEKGKNVKSSDVIQLTNISARKQESDSIKDQNHESEKVVRSDSEKEKYVQKSRYLAGGLIFLLLIALALISWKIYKSKI